MARAELLAIGLLLTPPAAYAAPAADWSGPWNVVARFASGSSAAVMTLDRGADGAITGTSGPLDEVGTWPLSVSGREEGGRLVLTLSRNNQATGTLTLRQAKDGLAGEGALYGVAVTVTAARDPARRPSRSTTSRRPPSRPATRPTRRRCCIWRRATRCARRPWTTRAATPA